MNYLLSKIKGDKYIWLVVVILAMCSILAVYSSTKVLASIHGGHAELFALRQAFFLVVGLGVMFVAHRANYNYYSKAAQYLMYACIPILAYTLLFGRTGRWLSIPILNLSIQPSELAKVVLIMYLARVLSKNQATIKSFKDGFYPILAPVILLCALILPADLSTAALIFLTSLIMMFVGRISFKYIGGLLGASVLVGGIFVFILFSIPDSLMRGRMPVWKQRLSYFQAHWNGSEAEKKQRLSYHEKQAYIAIANGGTIGQGAGKSYQKNFLPEAYADYIYAIIVEEYGLFGGIFILSLYLFFFYRCILIFSKSQGSFGALLAISLAISLVIQAMMNMMVTVGLMPVTGVTLPLISKGGTSTLVTCFAIGVILSVDQYYETEGKKVTPKPKGPRPVEPEKKRKKRLNLGKI